MAFVSLEFIVFFPIVLALYYVLKGVARKISLIVASLYFYATFMRQYTLALYSLILIFYITGILIDRQKRRATRRLLFILSLVLLTAILFTFKYYGFFTENLTLLTGKKLLPNFNLFIFVGISFIVFQLIAYITDVYNGKVIPEKNLLDFIIFVSYFPKLISGPIERAGNLLDQIKNCGKINLEYSVFINGLKIFVLGFFMKVVIADRLDPAINRLFSDPSSYNSLQVFACIILYTIQLYTDFAGYSYMAVGTSEMLGIKITNNFYLPLFATSISEFWRRWHISLSLWLRDYIFLPVSYFTLRILSKTRKTVRKPENIAYIFSTILTMGLCGIWHGARWTFIVWGFIHIFYLVFSFSTKKIRKNIIKKTGIAKSIILKPLRIVTTFFFIAYAFVVFRADSLASALIIITKPFLFDFSVKNRYWFFSYYELIIAAGSAALLFLFEASVYRKDKALNHPVQQEINIYIFFMLLLLIIFFGNFTEIDFLYFKF